MDSNTVDRRKIKQQYKEQAEIGGIYRYADSVTKWQSVLCATPNLKGKYSLLQFAKMQGKHGEPALQAYWDENGGSNIELVELEQLKRNDMQSLNEFKEDLAALLEMWREKEKQKE